jgi:hypothetical protein
MEKAVFPIPSKFYLFDPLKTFHRKTTSIWWWWWWWREDCHLSQAPSIKWNFTLWLYKMALFTRSLKYRRYQNMWKIECRDILIHVLANYCHVLAFNCNKKLCRNNWEQYFSGSSIFLSRKFSVQHILEQLNIQGLSFHSQNTIFCTFHCTFHLLMIQAMS